MRSAAEVFIKDSVAPDAEIIPKSDAPSVPEGVAAIAKPSIPDDLFVALRDDLWSGPNSNGLQVLDAQDGNFYRTWTVNTPALTEEKPPTRTPLGVARSIAGSLERIIWRRPESHEAGRFNTDVSLLVDREFKAEERKQGKQTGQADPGRLNEGNLVFRAATSSTGR